MTGPQPEKQATESMTHCPKKKRILFSCSHSSFLGFFFPHHKAVTEKAAGASRQHSQEPGSRRGPAERPLPTAAGRRAGGTANRPRKLSDPTPAPPRREPASSQPLQQHACRQKHRYRWQNAHPGWADLQLGACRWKRI